MSTQAESQNLQNQEPATWGAVTKTLLAAEFAALFFLLPTLWYLDVIRVPLILFLCLFALACFLYLRFVPGFDRTQLINARVVPARFGQVLTVFAVNAVVIAALVYFFLPDQFFSMPGRSIALWAAIMILYPLFSVYPQEIIYRVFFFERYKHLFPTKWAIIAASAVAFGYGHIIFENNIAVIMTLLGGILFAKTYYESKSTLLVAIEHALYGDLIFTIGLGQYFYTGAVQG